MSKVVALRRATKSIRSRQKGRPRVKTYKGRVAKSKRS